MLTQRSIQFYFISYFFILQNDYDTDGCYYDDICQWWHMMSQSTWWPVSAFLCMQSSNSGIRIHGLQHVKTVVKVSFIGFEVRLASLKLNSQCVSNMSRTQAVHTQAVHTLAVRTQAVRTQAVSTQAVPFVWMPAPPPPSHSPRAWRGQEWLWRRSNLHSEESVKRVWREWGENVKKVCTE